MPCTMKVRYRNNFPTALFTLPTLWAKVGKKGLKAVCFEIITPFTRFKRKVF